MNIGDRVKSLREQKNMTQQELATRLGYKSKSSVAHIENGRDIPRSMVVTLADILDTTPAYLMGWDEPSENGAKKEAPIIADERQALTDDELLEAFRNHPKDHQRHILDKLMLEYLDNPESQKE